jgi:hypothetical protein
MALTDRPRLSDAEQRMSLAKYYDLPLYPPGPREMQLMQHLPLDPRDALPAQNLLDLLEPTGYHTAEYGYCRLPDGSGYMAMYFVYPFCTPQMLGWWFRWLNVLPKDQPEGTGNLKYKLWCPPDHWTHAFTNGKDISDGMWAIESIDLGEGDDKVYYLRERLDAKQHGLSSERETELREAGCWVDLANVTFYSPEEPPRQQYPGSWLWLTLSRPCAQGGVELRTRLWMGCGAKDGEIFFDPSTPSARLSEETMRKFLIHTTVEHQHLAKLLPKLYEEYSDRPDDEV